MAESDARFIDRMLANNWTWSTADRDRLFTLARRGAEMQWRPIEEAPKDGTPIRLWRPAAEGRKWQQEVAAIWESEYEGSEYEGWAWPDDPVVDIFGPRDWLEEGDCYTSKAFTHWMPLPPPPAGETSDE